MDFPYQTTTHSAEETQTVGRELAAYLISQKKSHATIICLYGELGSGKTTFTQGFAQELGIAERLLSPTFILMRTYLGKDTIYLHHIDLYRMENVSQLKAVDLPELMNNPQAIILIEWAERLGENIPKKRIDIHFDTVGEETRTIEIKNIS